MRYATVTSTTPLEVTPHDGATEPVAVADFPDGMTLAVDDVVLIDEIGKVGKSIVVVQRMNG